MQLRAAATRNTNTARLRRRPKPVASTAQGHGDARIEHVARLFEDVLKELVGQSDHRDLVGGRRHLHRLAEGDSTVSISLCTECPREYRSQTFSFMSLQNRLDDGLFLYSS